MLFRSLLHSEAHGSEPEKEQDVFPVAPELSVPAPTCSRRSGPAPRVLSAPQESDYRAICTLPGCGKACSPELEWDRAYI